jgi:hypothetical protein
MKENISEVLNVRKRGGEVDHPPGNSNIGSVEIPFLNLTNHLQKKEED